MLESLIISTCLLGNINACQHSIQAYGKHTKIEERINELGLKYPFLVYTTSLAGMVKEQKASVPLIHNNLLYSIESDEKIYVKNQLIWRYGF